MKQKYFDTVLDKIYDEAETFDMMSLRDKTVYEGVFQFRMRLLDSLFKINLN